MTKQPTLDVGAPTREQCEAFEAENNLWLEAMLALIQSPAGDETRTRIQDAEANPL